MFFIISRQRNFILSVIIPHIFSIIAISDFESKFVYPSLFQQECNFIALLVTNFRCRTQVCLSRVCGLLITWPSYAHTLRHFPVSNGSMYVGQYTAPPHRPHQPPIQQHTHMLSSCYGTQPVSSPWHISLHGWLITVRAQLTLVVPSVTHWLTNCYCPTASASHGWPLLSHVDILRDIGLLWFVHVVCLKCSCFTLLMTDNNWLRQYGVKYDSFSWYDVLFVSFRNWYVETIFFFFKLSGWTERLTQFGTVV